MLDRSFVHLPGVSLTLERELWQDGCRDWGCLLEGFEKWSDRFEDPTKVKRFLKSSIKAKTAEEHQFFRRRLGPKNAWRAYPDFKSSCVYLDIETDGGSGGASITTIGMSDSEGFTALIRGVDLGNFPDLISKYSMIVTFFGTGFDLPVIQKRFPLVPIDQIHLDLFPTLRQLGYRGGLKKIEKEFGITRSPETDGLTGRDAIHLWNRYERFGDEGALERLVAYNREDVVNLQTLADAAYDQLWRRCQKQMTTQRED